SCQAAGKDRVKDEPTVQQFITLRAQGVSFARIAEQLGVSKTTLIEWSRRHQHLIQNLRSIEWESFVDIVMVSRQERLRALSARLCLCRSAGSRGAVARRLRRAFDWSVFWSSAFCVSTSPNRPWRVTLHSPSPPSMERAGMRGENQRSNGQSVWKIRFSVKKR